MKWYSIVRDIVQTHDDLKHRFEARYWNECVQNKIRRKLEFGKYIPGRETYEQYVIKHIAMCRNLKPESTEKQIVNKLAHH